MAEQLTCPQCRQPAFVATEPCPACGFVPHPGASAGRARRSAAIWAAFDLGLLAAALACPWWYAPAPSTGQVFSATAQPETAGQADILVNARQEFLVGEAIHTSVPLAVAQTLHGATPPASVRIRAQRGALLENVLRLAAELARSGTTQVAIELPAP